MIITITLNPAVDISYRLDQLSIDSTNRVEEVSKTAGGKGLNVARVVKQLNEQVGASGFLGGSLGGFIRKQLGQDGIEDLFVDIHGETRNCIAVIHEGRQTEILESGPTILQKEQDQFLHEFSEYVKKADIVSISGSLPKGLDGDFYKELIKIVNQNGKRAFLDTGGALLSDVLSGKNKPYLIKPNEEELADLLEKKSLSDSEIVESLKSPLFAGIEWVVVTLGGRGAIVRCAEKLYRVTIPTVKVVNPVGSGDSVIAGFAAGMKRDHDEEKLIKFGLTMGVLNAMEEQTGSIDPERISEIMKQVNVDLI